MFKTILVPNDGSELSNKAIDAALKFAKINHSKIITLSIAELYPLAPLTEGGLVTDLRLYEQNMLELAKLNVRKVADRASATGICCETVTTQAFDPDKEIIHAAEKYHCDVIFMASHGRGSLSSLFFGSTTQKVLAHSTIPVLILR